MFRSKSQSSKSNANNEATNNGGLSHDDLFEILQMELENLSTASKSAEGTFFFCRRHLSNK